MHADEADAEAPAGVLERQRRPGRPVRLLAERERFAPSLDLIREATGLARDDLLLAFDFTTMSVTRNLFFAEQAIAEKEAAADELAAKLEDIITGEQGELVRQDGGQMSLQLMDEVLFRSGEAQLTDSGKKVMQAVGEALNSYPDKQVWVQGHTDDVPISRDTRAEFASNWELSAARALNVVHFLQQQVGVDPRRLAAVAFGQYRPVSVKSKAKNRRIEIVLFPKEVVVIDK